MTEIATEPIYKKVGRRYVPVASARSWYDGHDQMAVGSYRLVHAYSCGGRRYEYDVTPETAAVVAALTKFRVEVEAAIQKAAQARPITGTTTQYTKKQLAVMEKFRADMAAAGGLVPTHWQHSSAWEISDAAAKALRKCMEESK